MATPYVTHSFTFPHIPYHAALRHIHTPEKCVEVYAVLPPGFRITRTEPPQRLGNYHSIAFRFNTAIHNRRQTHHGVMFSSSPDCSQLLFMDTTGTAYMLVSYSVRAYCPPRASSASYEGGHKLQITGTFLRPSTLIEAICTRRKVDAQKVQNAIQSHRPENEDRHLRAYRQRILKLN
jgi:hypothetical protein